MKKNRFPLAVFIAFLAVLLSILVWKYLPPPSTKPQLGPKAGTPNPASTPLLSSSTPLSAPVKIKNEAAMKDYMERSNKDHNYDWKVSLSFYGKVVDEENKPVQGASVFLSWNTVWGLDAPEGSKQKTMQSDAQGLFQLTGEHGKVLSVRVEKDGYYVLQGSSGSVGFEFANPSSDYYYQPDSSKPVIFHLQSMSKGVALVSKNVDLTLDQTQPQNGVDLMTGQITSTGSLQVFANKPELQIGHPVRFPWSMKVTLKNGGFVETQEQLPFQAPDQGYASTLDFENTDPKASTWRCTVNATYYFHLTDSNIYGVMSVNTDALSHRVHLNYSYNPTSGDQNLEPDPSKQVKAP